MSLTKDGYQYYDWNDRPIRLKDQQVEDYAGDGKWIPSRLKPSQIMQPGGDLTPVADEAELQQLLQRADEGADEEGADDPDSGAR